MKLRKHCHLISSALLLAGCGGIGATPNPTSVAPKAKVSVATAMAADLTVELLADSALTNGLTPVYFKLTDSAGQPVTDAAVTFVPMMAMANGKNHSCPVMGAPTLGSDGLYVTDVVFSMASTDVDTWSATVGVTRPGAATVQASFPLLSVTDSGRFKAIAYTDPATGTITKYPTSLNFVNPPTIGLNPIVFTVHTMQDMMTFPPIDDAVLALDPQMPSMGHGSPGSVDPTWVSPGRYEGKLSFSMAGEWQTTVTISRAGVVVGAPVFTTNF